MQDFLYLDAKYKCQRFIKKLKIILYGTAENELGNGWRYYDLGLQNAFLTLKDADMGIDRIILGLRDASALKSVLNIPETEDVVAVIALGYRTSPEIKFPKEKKRLKSLNFLNKYLLKELEKSSHPVPTSSSMQTKKALYIPVQGF